MSNQVIQDIVIPIVSRMMLEEGDFGPYGRPMVRDEQLEQFLEEEMRRMFGVIGADGCQHLREQLEQARKYDPYSFEYALRQLLRKYVKIQVKLRQQKKKQVILEGPPDRFEAQRRAYQMLFNQTDR